jgi:hypothetical protein
MARVAGSESRGSVFNAPRLGNQVAEAEQGARWSLQLLQSDRAP